ncbi:hypothetical protein [Lactobacillus jensenii]|uniref:TRASH domain-containing protein n=1 Tax=Lactobacillus jensenii TaxID=109790 RepID=A0ABU9FIJ9_LACJE|nr:hypothetical protein [Lactobacillus jensenii]DAR66712.1 MAG TPA: Phenol hydroxylase component phN, Phenol, diiron, four-helix bundle, regulatory.3A [Caudoviricetes sp.]MCW8072182.1 hypothetical protein [Lactobacillus jensenii]MCW8089590.1 hypothetical protein [Lactobacillus jensenii]MDK8236072.1 hypothetical protein [Lactobacillus jensenii]MDT9544360.1 hypothetical protein [Lactobacillus jensenii]
MTSTLFQCEQCGKRIRGKTYTFYDDCIPYFFCSLDCRELFIADDNYTEEFKNIQDAIKEIYPDKWEVMQLDFQEFLDKYFNDLYLYNHNISPDAKHWKKHDYNEYECKGLKISFISLNDILLSNKDNVLGRIINGEVKDYPHEY